MSIYQVIYLTLLILCLLISLFTYKQSKSLKIFPLLLCLSLITEITVDFMYFLLNYDNEYNIIYHIYIPLEYSFLSYFFYLNNSHQVKKYIEVSIPLFILASGLISGFVISITDFPGLNFNLAGTLLILWSVITLFSVQPTANVSITSLPVFWICIGILVFHTGIFFFNGVYEHIQQKNSLLAQQLHRLTIKSLNYIMYICFSIAFICSHRMKKYSSQ